MTKSTQENPEGTDVRYTVQYRESDDESWFVAGDIYGYDHRGDALAVANANLHRKGTTEVRIIEITTTSRIIETSSRD